jgi:dTDP-4-amino-4,6-dideoxygalactose transaminase
MSERLAIDGGTPVRSKPFPSRAAGFGEEEMAHLADVVHSGNLFRVGGKKTEQVEKRFAALLGVKHAHAVTSGTAAIHTAVACINPDPGDEIITTSMTDMGTVIGIIYQNAIPIFADVVKDGYLLDPKAVRAAITPRTRAIIVVHLWGMAAEMDEFLAMGREHGIAIIEDCAQAYLTSYRGRLVGTMGEMGAFSLQQSKHITCGDGGLVVTNRDDLAHHARMFSDKGWDRDADDRGHAFLAMNYRITELQSAVVLAQLGKVEQVVARRRALGDLLSQRIAGIPGLYPPPDSKVSGNTYWYYPLRIREREFGMPRERFIAALNAEGVSCWIWLASTPLYLFDALRKQITFGKSHHPFDCSCASRRVEYAPGLCPNAEQTLREFVVLTVHEFYTEKDVEDMAAAIRKVAGAARR